MTMQKNLCCDLLGFSWNCCRNLIRLAPVARSASSRSRLPRRCYGTSGQLPPKGGLERGRARARPACYPLNAQVRGFERWTINKVHESLLHAEMKSDRISVERASKRVHAQPLMVSLPPMPDERRAIDDAGVWQTPRGAARSNSPPRPWWDPPPLWPRLYYLLGDCSAEAGARLQQLFVHSHGIAPAVTKSKECCGGRLYGQRQRAG
jgi:hypothetical protein